MESKDGLSNNLYAPNHGYMFKYLAHSLAQSRWRNKVYIRGLFDK